MGSVQSEVECPECHYKLAMNDCYYKTGENYFFCKRCGHSESHTIKLDANGNMKVPLEYEDKVQKACGSFILRGEHGSGTLGSIIEESFLNGFIEDVKAQKFNQTVTEAYYTKRSKLGWVLCNVFGEEAIYIEDEDDINEMIYMHKTKNECGVE